jgi:poly(A) polymerase
MSNLEEEALEIIRCLKAHQFKAYLAGGYVRDMLMGAEPQDYDIATNASPEQITKLFNKTFILGIQFPVVMVLINQHQFQLTSFRGSEPWSEQSDTQLRDFTINGLLYDPLQDKLLDYVGGKKDIEAKIIRAIGDPTARFREDWLRLMRAVRLASRYQFQIEKNTLVALKNLAPGIVVVSPERVRDELIKIIVDKNAYHGAKLLLDTGIMQHILPEVAAMDGIEQPPDYHPEGDVLTHTLFMFEHMRDPSPELAVAVLLHDIGKPLTYEKTERITFKNHAQLGTQLAEDICLRLRFSRNETNRIISLVKNHLKFIHVREMRLNKLKRFLQMEDFRDHLELHRLDCLASHGNLSNWEFCQEKLKELSPQDLRPPRLITGHDLIAMGFKPGPLFSEVLMLIEDAQLEEKLSTREEALERAADYLAKKS